MDGNSEQLQVINLKQLPIIEERLRDVKAKIEQRTSAVMALAVTEETRTDVKKIRTEVRKELEGYEAQRMAVKKAIMTPYEQFEAVYKECVSNPYKAADEALGKKIADVEVGIKQQKEDDVRAFFTELTSGFGLDWLKFEQMNLKVTLTCTPKAMKTAITQSVTKIVRDCAALEENPDRDEIMVEYQKSLDLGSACQIVQQRHKQLEAQRRAAEGWLVDDCPVHGVLPKLVNDLPALRTFDTVRHRQLLPLLGLQIVRSVGIPGKQDRLSPVQAVHHAPHHIGYDVPRLRRSQGS